MVDVNGAVAAMKPFATTPTFLKYSNKIRRAPIDQKAITQLAPMFQKLIKAAPNLGITKIVIEEILMTLSEEGGFEFRSRRERKDWALEIGKRMRGICRHVQQYRIKRERAPEWFKALGLEPVDGGFDEDGGEEDEQAEEEDPSEFVPDVPVHSDDDEGPAKMKRPAAAESPSTAACSSSSLSAAKMKRPAAAESAATVEYDYKWDTENVIGSRKPKDAKKADHPEMALLVIIRDKDDTDNVSCRFKDDSEVVFPQMTVGNYKRLKELKEGTNGDKGAKTAKAKEGAKTAKAKACPKTTGLARVDVDLFSGKSTKGEDVWVTMRWDQPKGKPKVRLCCIKVSEQPQLIQMNIESFNLHPKGELESERRCISWCNGVAKQYCDGELTRDTAKQIKAEYLQKLAESPHGGDIKRRPAAADVMKKPTADAPVLPDEAAAPVTAAAEAVPVTPKKRPAATDGSPAAAAPEDATAGAALASAPQPEPAKKSRIAPPPASDEDS